jgi:hypothetical protein
MRRPGVPVLTFLLGLRPREPQTLAASGKLAETAL